MQLKLLAQTLDDIRHVDESGEYWFARDLHELLGYKRWENFKNAVGRAMSSVKTTEQSVEDHFRQVTKMVQLGSGSQREVEDYRLTRYACYLIAQNGDPQIPEIAFAQMYFAMQTRKQEVLEKNIEEIERMVSREKLSETEKEFAKTIYERGVDSLGIGEIKSEGDRALFGGKNTLQMKKKLGVEKGPLADVLPTVVLKAKDLAAEMTTVNTKRNDLQGKAPIRQEHIRNNNGVRRTLVEAGIEPENLPPEENIKQVASRHKKTAKQLKGLKPDELIMD